MCMHVNNQKGDVFRWMCLAVLELHMLTHQKGLPLQLVLGPSAAVCRSSASGTQRPEDGSRSQCSL